MRLKVGLLLAISLLVSFNTQAKLGMGIGFTQSQSPYRSVTSNPNVIPAYINYEGDKGYFRGVEGGVHLFSIGERGKKLTISALAAFRLEGYKSSDSYYLQGMKKREWSIDMGARTSFQLGYNRFTARMVGDTLGRHKGYSAGVGYARIIPITKKLMLIPSSHVTWQNSKLLDYYYGVKNNEVTQNREAYEAKSGVQLRASFLANYAINPNTSLMLVATARRLPNSVTDSPLVARDYVSTVFGAINFSF